MNKKQFYIERILAIIAATILLQTLYFKFTAHPDSVYIFTEMGVEPFGRISLGIIELIASILLLYPKTSHIGGVLGIGIMLGAIISHLFILGVNVNNDGGTLFILATTVFVCSFVVVILKKNELLSLLKWN